MENDRKSKGIIIGVLCAVIIFMSIGFAALSTRLTINGSASLSDIWNVQIIDITKKEASTGVTEAANTPTFTSTTATFDVALKEPGDYVIYTITVKNKGTLDATLSKITETYAKSTTDSSAGSDAIIYTVTPASGSEQGSTLVKETGTHTFDVKVEYDANAIGENAPKEDDPTTKIAVITLDYVQK